MENVHHIQGRDVNAEDIEQIRSLISTHSDWNRRRLSVELAQAWNWRAASGQLKDMAARTLLLKLDQRGWIKLPPRRRIAPKRLPIAPELPLENGGESPISAKLSELTPLTLKIVPSNHPPFSSYLAHHHYLGYRGPVGENLAYLVSDRHGRALACMLFGAPAWKVASRDRFIGWDPSLRPRRLHLLANNTRFLILPWVRAPHLASHVLARITRRLCQDWQSRYGHPIYLVETFVDRERFRGTCYRSANWIHVGQTQGRSRQDRTRTIHVPIKDVYLQPLTVRFREELCRVDG